MWKESGLSFCLEKFLLRGGSGAVVAAQKKARAHPAVVLPLEVGVVMTRRLETPVPRRPSDEAELKSLSSSKISKYTRKLAAMSSREEQCQRMDSPPRTYARTLQQRHCPFSFHVLAKKK